ncbi:thrombospondin type 3 repeat-containing protein [Patescibacteria group bacterium]|nr:thrombospondin type 3 repeat-containing protein [Patescibacteria group bacterium]
MNTIQRSDSDVSGRESSKSEENQTASNPEKVDFVKTQAEDFHVETMPRASGGGGGGVKNKKKRVVVVVIILAVFILILSGVFAYLYREQLGISTLLGTKVTPVVETETKVTKEVTGPDDQMHIYEELTKRVALLEKGKDGDTVVLLEGKITKIETYLKQTDTDEDGISDYEEIVDHETDPDNKDTDGDGFNDGDEINNGYNPNGEGEIGDDTSDVQDESTDNDQEIVDEPADDTDGQDVPDDTDTNGLHEKGFNSAVPGDYVGRFALTDVEVSGNDIKLTINEIGEVSGSFTFEYDGSAYRTEFNGALEVDDSGEQYYTSLEAKTISGSNQDDLKVDMFLTFNADKSELNGVMQFLDSDYAFLNDQKGEVFLNQGEIALNGISITTEDAGGNEATTVLLQ